MATVWAPPAPITLTTAALVRHMPGGAPATVGPVRPMSCGLRFTTLGSGQADPAGVTEVRIRSPSATSVQEPGALTDLGMRT